MTETTHSSVLGEPTKDLFIDMLTRDISLRAAIVDLVDNATDGARRLRPDVSPDFDGLRVELLTRPDRFVISDNCGGIPLNTARRYAFRFGRPREMPPTPHSVGQFGVGMKRAIFKMGHHFHLATCTAEHRFVVEQDIQAWAADTDNWDFSLQDLISQPTPEGDRGTTIVVTTLKPDVATAFADQTWRNRLRVALRTRLRRFISQGLTITYNGAPVTVDPLVFLNQHGLAPAFRSDVFPGESPVQVQLYCGLGPSHERLAGWHVFCNDRLVLDADKTESTGWGVTAGARMPRFHPQYNHFRGYAFFSAADAGRLPWTTTKTGLDAESPIYRATRQKMNTLARPVIDFLNQLKKEKERIRQTDPSQLGPLATLVDESGEAHIDEIEYRDVFIPPRAEMPPPPPSTTRIQYSESLERVARVKAALGVTTNKEVGERTFKYYYHSEIDE